MLLPPQVKEDEAPKLLLRGFVPGSPPAEPGGALAVDGHKSDTSDRSGTHPLTPGDFTRIFGTIKPQLKTATEDTRTDSSSQVKASSIPPGWASFAADST